MLHWKSKPREMTRHVVFFNRSFYPDNAATGQLLTELCDALVKTYGYRVTVVVGVPLSTDNPGPYRRTLKSNQVYGAIRILRVGGTQFSKRTFWGRACNYIAYFVGACCAVFRLDRPDVVVAFTDPPIIGLAGCLCAKLFRARFVMAFQDIFPEVGELLEDFHSNLVNNSLQAINRFLVSTADHITALGPTMRRRLVEKKGADASKVSVIPSWTDCDKIKPGPKDNDFARHHNLVGKFVVMHSGNIGLSQALESVLKSFVYLQEFRDIHVVFIGDGVKRDSLEQQSRDLGLNNVSFLPFQQKNALTTAWAAADVFIVSLKSGLAGYIVPSKLYGILAAGKPYVAAVDTESEVAIISNEFECGLLAEPENPKDIADKVLTLYRDPVLRMRMGENARNASFQFDQKIQVAAYHTLFTKLISGRTA
jgi:colanic acid biosynthesis glycosyl transferase WcaI